MNLWDHSGCKAMNLATRLSHRAEFLIFNSKSTYPNSVILINLWRVNIVPAISFRYIFFNYCKICFIYQAHLDVIKTITTYHGFISDIMFWIECLYLENKYPFFLHRLWTALDVCGVLVFPAFHLTPGTSRTYIILIWFILIIEWTWLSPDTKVTNLKIEIFFILCLLHFYKLYRLNSSLIKITDYDVFHKEAICYLKHILWLHEL